MHFHRTFLTCVTLSALATMSGAQMPPAWPGYGGDFQHTSQALQNSQRMLRIAWQVPVDMGAQYSGVDLLTHYGCPSITNSGAVLMSVKTGIDDGYIFQARRASDGGLIWSQDTGYSVPSHDAWIPSVSGVITNPQNTYAMPGVGGAIVFRSYADSSVGRSRTVHFYGEDVYQNDAPALDAAVKICTPITTDNRGTIYFGYRVEGSTASGLQSGFARIDPRGFGTFVAASSLTGNPNVDRPAMNAGVVLNKARTAMYVVVKTPNETGYLVEVSLRNFQTMHQVLLVDPLTHGPAPVIDESSGSPTVGPDGNVYFGVMNQNFGANNYRGMLLQFTANLASAGAPSAFGWDDCPSIVPKSCLPGYSGSSKYLLLTKYNNYVGAGTGDGKDRVAIVDPNATMTDPVTGITVMNVVQSILGVTPDLNNIDQFPGAVREWCINAAAIDVPGKCAIINSEDGHVYKWDFRSNSLIQNVTLTEGVGEAYTPTAIGRDGTVYAINNATLFAIRS